MAPEIVERLAAMLDYNLQQLAGPKCTELKVNDPKKYRFNPAHLLSELVDVYLHLSHRIEFVNAVAKDGRSYNKNVFVKAGHILFRKAIKTQEEVNTLMTFVDRVETTKQTDVKEEEEMGEIPDEFLGMSNFFYLFFLNISFIFFRLDGYYRCLTI